MWWFREVIAMWQCVCDLNGYCGSVFVISMLYIHILDFKTSVS